MALRAGLKALSNPSREGKICTWSLPLENSLAECAVQRMRTRMVLDPTGRRLLRDRPELPRNTLGRVPDTRTPVRHMPEADDELKYVMLRYRQVHDFFHVLTGLGTSLEEEIAVKWFELAQTGLPMTLLSGVLGPLRLTSTDRKLLFTEHVPWLLQCGTRSKFLMNVYYEEILEKPMDQVRKEVGIFLPAGFVPQDALIKD
ncbi:coenzyme Q biosynthesis protein Coq4-domain-containing protein [Obelidium mucronatum]|nr:coenzyme Q biosynthesis protein Coq4-domain-containing protein [Obelidium mucronatum]